MRIAVPVLNDTVSSQLSACEGFRFYEDDHGKIVRHFFIALEEKSLNAAVTLLEQYSIDALLCSPLSPAEHEEIALAGIMLFPNFSGAPDDAALQFLSGAIVFDESNTCNACGHGHSCSFDCKSCGIKH